MLKQHLRIQSDEKESLSRKHNIEDYVEFIPKFVPPGDDLLKNLHEDLRTFGLENGTSDKVKTAWIGSTEYEYGNTHHPANPI